MSRLYAKESGAWVEYNANALYRKENGQWLPHNWSEIDRRKHLYEWLPSVGTPIHYVSLGDSIAAGHTIDANWNTDYGERSQYGVNGNTTTKIVSGSYTDLIRNELVGIYGENGVAVHSFARSGDTVTDLMNKLSHEAVRSAIAKADLVTVCIGANDVLQPAVTRLGEYISTGSLTNAEAIIATNMANLNNDSHPASFTSLFNKLSEINPNAKYVFTTIYNPYKYLWIEEGRDGFFGPMLGTIPNWDLDVPIINKHIDMDNLIKDGLLEASAFQLVFNRVNGLDAWSESRVNELNNVLRNKISAYQAINPNFLLVDTKTVFDLFPDKTDATNDVDYSDLVSVEFTRTFNTAKMNWGALWAGSTAEKFWYDLGTKHLYWINAFPSTNPMDYVDFHLEAYAAELVQLVSEKVIIPDVDPHPEYHGHQVMKRSFTNGIGLVKYEANGGNYERGDIVRPNEKLGISDPTRVGYAFGGWYTDAEFNQAFDPNSTDYVESIENFTLADLVDGNSIKVKTPKTTTLYAKWYSDK